MKFNIETATDTDIIELTKVEIGSKSQSIPELVGPVDIDYDIRLYRWDTYFKGKSPQTSRPQRMVFKAVVEDQIVGYIAGHLTIRFNFDAEIQSFYVLKNNQHCGVGSALLMSLTEWLLSLHVKSLCVGIVPENKYRRFYYKYGGLDLNEHWIYWYDLRSISTHFGISG